MKHFADNNAPHGRDVFVDSDRKRRPPALSVTIEDSTIRVTLSKLSNPRLEIGGVLLGPFDLEPGAGRLVSHGVRSGWLLVITTQSRQAIFALKRRLGEGETPSRAVEVRV